MIKFFKKNLYKVINKLDKFYTNYCYELYREKYNIDSSFRFNGKNIKLYGEGKIELGENSYIGESSTIQANIDCFVKIGKNCRISHNVRIYTTSNIADQDFNLKDIAKYSKPVIIEDNVWIGANVFINPGVVIKENSIVGANSVVTKDIEKSSIYGGVPAKLIKRKKIFIEEGVKV